jgi:hypothetical protein
MPAGPTPASNFADTLIEVWRQSLLDKSEVVTLGAHRYPVTTSKKKRLRQVDFIFEGNSIVGIQQNPETKSNWAKLARAGKKIMQFIQEGRYVAVVADGKITFYGKRPAT